MAETTPSGGRERVDAVVARAVDEDRLERFRREDAEHEAADKRQAAAESAFEAGLAAGLDAATPPAQVPAPNLCEDCGEELQVLGSVCPACFAEANNVLADVAWWERFAGEYAAAVRFVLKYKRLDAESYIALREGFGGYPQEVTPFRRASDRILRYGAGHLRELDGTGLDEAHDVLVAAFEIPLLTGQCHSLVITPAEHLSLRRAFVLAKDVVGEVGDHAKRIRGEYFGLHKASCDCTGCLERGSKARREGMVRDNLASAGATPPPQPPIGVSSAPDSSEGEFLTPDEIVAQVCRLTRIARFLRQGPYLGVRASRNPRVIRHSRLGAYHLGLLDRGAKVALLRSMASLAGAEATTAEDHSFTRVDLLWETASALRDAAREIHAAAILIGGAETELGPVFIEPEDARIKSAIASGAIGPDAAAASGFSPGVILELKCIYRCARGARALSKVAASLKRRLDAEPESTFILTTAALADGINAVVDIAAALNLDTGTALARPESPPWAILGTEDATATTVAPQDAGRDERVSSSSDRGPWIRGTRSMRDFLRNEGYPVASKALNDALKAGLVHGARRDKAGGRVTWLAHAEALRTWGSLRSSGSSAAPAE